MGGADGGPAWWMTTVEQLEPDSEVFITLTAPSSTEYCCHNLHLFDLTLGASPLLFVQHQDSGVERS